MNRILLATLFAADRHHFHPRKPENLKKPRNLERQTETPENKNKNNIKNIF